MGSVRGRGGRHEYKREVEVECGARQKYQSRSVDGSAGEGITAWQGRKDISEAHDYLLSTVSLPVLLFILNLCRTAAYMHAYIRDEEQDDGESASTASPAPEASSHCHHPARHGLLVRGPHSRPKSR
jgi:hypothetical protein